MLMDRGVALFLLITATLSTLLAVISAVVSWRGASRSTQLRKWLRVQLQTKLSQSALAALAAEQAEFSSTLSSLTKTVKRLTARYGMQDARAAQSEGDAAKPPPVEAGKEALRRWARENGKYPRAVPPQFDESRQE